jgi:HlyD family secretion protein
MRSNTLKWLRLSILMTTIAGCTRAVKPDAYGNVEAIEVVVGAEATGRLVSFDATEGQQIVVDAVVGAIDSTDLSLERIN